MVLSIEKLRREHRNIRAVLNLVDAELRGIEQGSVRSQSRLRIGLDYLRYYFDQVHHPHEDLIFEYLVARLSRPNGTVKLLLDKHEDIYRLGAELDCWRNTASGLHDERSRKEFIVTCKRYLQLETEHLAKEEETAFPLAEQWLTPTDWKAVASRHRAQEDPLFGEKMSQRYAGIYQLLMNSEHFR